MANDSNGARWPKVLAASVGALGLLAIAGFVGFQAWLPGFVRGEVEKAAAGYGVLLSDCTITYERSGFELTRVSLADCSVATAPPTDARGTVKLIDVALTNNQPRKVFLSGADIVVRGTPELEQWKDQLGRDGGLEVTGQGNRLAWVTDEGRPPAIVASDVQRLSLDADWAGKLVLADVLDGTVSFGERARLELKLRALPANTLVAEIDPDKSHGRLTLQLEQVPFMLFSGIVFSNLPAELATTTASGSLEMDVPYGLNPAQPKGRFDFTLSGLNFPVPRELAGLVYDTAPRISAAFTSNRTYTKFDAAQVNFQTGALAMKGKGRVQREGIQTHWTATMQGPLACSAIVSAAARVHLSGAPLGKELSEVASRISKRALDGSVNIIVAIDADSTDLAAAKVVKSVGMGCGLKPLPVPELAGLPEIVFKDLPQLRELPFPKDGLREGATGAGQGLQLPTLKDLPGKLPKLELPRLDLPAGKQAQPEPKP